MNRGALYGTDRTNLLSYAPGMEPYRYLPGDGSRFTGGWAVPEGVDLTKPCLWWFSMESYRNRSIYQESAYRANCGYFMTSMMVWCPNCHRRIFDISDAVSYPHKYGFQRSTGRT